MTIASMSVSKPSARHHRFSLEQYHRMIETSVLTRDDRVELINGEILDMSPIGKKHQAVVNRLLAFFRTLGPEEVVISVQGPVLLDEQSEPQPDIALLKYRADFYGDVLAGPADVQLLIEVADSSLEMDRRFKIPLYAKAGVGEVWVVDVNTQTIEVMRDPAEGHYRKAKTLKRGDELACGAFAELALKVDRLFPA